MKSRGIKNENPGYVPSFVGDLSRATSSAFGFAQPSRGHSNGALRRMTKMAMISMPKISGIRDQRMPAIDNAISRNASAALPRR